MKPNRLQAVLDRVSTPASTVLRPDAPKPAVPPKIKTVLVGAHLDPAYLKQLRILAAEEGTTSNALIREALDLLFVKKGKAAVREPKGTGQA